MKVAYIRVSTEEQNTARQDAMMKAQGVEKVFEEKVSGKNTERPELKKMMDFVREGDTVVVESYSRFSRSTSDLFELVEALERKGVQFVSLKENVDTTTPQGKLIFTIFAGLVQFEREQTLQRQREGIEAAKAKDAILKAEGKEAETYKGRKPIAVDADTFKKEVTAWREGRQTAIATMDKLGLKPNTFYRRVKEFDEKAE